MAIAFLCPELNGDHFYILNQTAIALLFYPRAIAFLV
jgi:hypothetical protein